jgi:hypothetical protein
VHADLQTSSHSYSVSLFDWSLFLSALLLSLSLFLSLSSSLSLSADTFVRKEGSWSLLNCVRFKSHHR